MKEEWLNLTVHEIAIAVEVLHGTGKTVHDNRPYHGFVLNLHDVSKDYCFSDGRVMHTGDFALFYLPKGSSYVVRGEHFGDCIAINFDADIEDAPFCMYPRNVDTIFKNFKKAAVAWKQGDASARALAMRAIYDALYRIFKENARGYTPTRSLDKIAPAIQTIREDFADPTLTVSALARKCGISEVYLRKIFISHFGVGPREYIIQKRIAYAQQLLASGQFTVSLVARMCGFSEPSHFSREFTRRCGKNPSQY